MSDELDDGLPAIRERTGPRAKRSKTLNLTRVTREEEQVEAFLYPERSFPRPKRRSDCAGVPRPCPYVGCRHHLFLEAKRTSLSLNFPGDQPWDVDVSCSLDVVDEHPSGLSLDQLARVLGITRERVRQIESVAMKAVLKQAGPELAEALRELIADEPEPASSGF